MKLGAEGSIGYRAADVRWSSRRDRTRPVDPTGCGDAFCGGFLVGLAESADLPAAMAYGSPLRRSRRRITVPHTRWSRTGTKPKDACTASRSKFQPIVGLCKEAA